MQYKNTQQAWSQSIHHSETFWAEAAKAIAWDKPWDRVFDDRNPPFYRWFNGGKLNTCFNAVDRHVLEGRGDQDAIIYDSPVTDTAYRISYRELQSQVAQFAGVLQNHQVKQGDRVIIYMPMVPQALIAMLACARIGAIHSVVFGGFAARELANRIDDAKPVLIVSASCGIELSHAVAYKELLDKAIDLAQHKPGHCIVLQRKQLKANLITGRDVDWDQAMHLAKAVPCLSIEATDPLYILYTSGTTGKPKGIVRDQGGHAVALMWTMQHIYNTQAGDVYWAASDIGWVVGHSYAVYGPLLNGCTTVIYEGKPVGTPNPGAFWRIIEQYRVNTLFTAPTAIRAIKKEDPDGHYLKQYDTSSLRYLFVAGERCDPDTLHWSGEQLGVPVIDHWWQTETGWSIAANCTGIELLPIKAGSATRAVVGYDVRVLDDEGNELPDGQMGNICIKLPLPPGCLSSLWNNNRYYQETYLSRFPGFYLSGDAGFRDEDGYLWIMGRTDDVINVAGHRLSTGAIEAVLASHSDIAECAVIGAADTLKGQIPVGLVVMKSTATKAHAILADELIQKVRQTIGPVVAFKKVVVVKRLPKTRSGKILRQVIRQIADKKPYTTPPTIDDPKILDEIKLLLD